MDSSDSIVILDLTDNELTDILSGPVHRLEILKRIARDHLSSTNKSYKRHRKLPRNITRNKRRRSQSR
jgi:hypothetical protein